MAHEALVNQYENALPALRARGESLRAELASLLRAQPVLKIHSVTLRLKTAQSLAHKLSRPDRSYDNLWDVTDLLGLRVITYFEDAVDHVGQVLESHLPVVFEHSVDKRRRRDAGAFGYRSLHYVCRLGESDGGPVHPKACCEVQVRTVLEHAWAEIEHDLGYKAREAIPSAGRRRLNRLAGLLELADQEFVAIRSELDKYALSLPSRIQAEGESVALDRFSLSALLECSEVRDLDCAIAQTLGKQLGDEAFFPEYLLRMLSSSGICTVAEARTGIRAHAGAIVSMVKPYFAFAWHAWSLSPDHMAQVFRGYSLFFLAHATVLKASALGIDKVERLAHLYRELDYPDDEHAAQRVASMLVEAFGEVG